MELLACNFRPGAIGFFNGREERKCENSKGLRDNVFSVGALPLSISVIQSFKE